MIGADGTERQRGGVRRRGGLQIQRRCLCLGHMQLSSIGCRWHAGNIGSGSSAQHGRGITHGSSGSAHGSLHGSGGVRMRMWMRVGMRMHVRCWWRCWTGGNVIRRIAILGGIGRAMSRHWHRWHGCGQHGIRNGSGGGSSGWCIGRIRHAHAIGGRLQYGSGESGVRVDGGVRPGDGDALALVLHAAVLEPHLDCALGQIQLCGQFAATWPGDIVLLVELLLETRQLITCEGGSIATNRRISGNL